MLSNNISHCHPTLPTKTQNMKVIIALAVVGFSMKDQRRIGGDNNDIVMVPVMFLRDIIFAFHHGYAKRFTTLSQNCRGNEEQIFNRSIIFPLLWWQGCFTAFA